MLFALSACGQSEGGYRVKSVLTLVEQEYSIAFRTGDYVGEFVPAAIKVLMADGTVDALAQRWFGSRMVGYWWELCPPRSDFCSGVLLRTN